MTGCSQLRRSMVFRHSVEGPRVPGGQNGHGDWAVGASGATEPMMAGAVIRRYWPSPGETRPLLLPTSCFYSEEAVQRSALGIRWTVRAGERTAHDRRRTRRQACVGDQRGHTIIAGELCSQAVWLLCRGWPPSVRGAFRGRCPRASVIVGLQTPQNSHGVIVHTACWPGHSRDRR